MFARGGRSALATVAGLAAMVLFGTVCSVDNAGLASGGGGAGGGGKGSGGSAGHAGGHGGGATGGMVGAGGVVATGGHGAGGVIGTGGVVATGGVVGTGGVIGTGGVATGGVVGTGGTVAAGGTVGTGGMVGTGGTVGTGGVAGGAGMGAGGVAGSGGLGGSASGGMNGTGGRGGAGGRPASCASFPNGLSFTTPTDGHLHCYWVHGNQIDWNSAETVCENEGGTLVTLLSEAENSFVVDFVSGLGLFTGIGMTGQVFIGATDGAALDDRNGGGDYAWITGEPWNYHNWHSGQPDNACTGCVGAGPSTACMCDHRGALAGDGTWYDRTETSMRPFVCEAVAK